MLVVKPNTATERYLNAVKESINVAHQDSGAGRGEAAEGAEDPAASALALESVLSCSAAREAVRDCLGQSSKDFAAAFLDELGRGGGGTERVGPDRKEDDGAEQRQREKEACEKRLREWETENERRLRDRSKARRKEEALTSARHGAIRRDKATHDGPTSLHPFSRNHDVNIGFYWAKGKDGLATRIGKHFDIIDSSPGSLSDAGYRSCLNRIAIGLSQIDNPICQNATALATNSHDRQLGNVI